MRAPTCDIVCLKCHRRPALMLSGMCYWGPGMTLSSRRDCKGCPDVVLRCTHGVLFCLFYTEGTEWPRGKCGTDSATWFWGLDLRMSPSMMLFVGKWKLDLIWGPDLRWVPDMMTQAWNDTEVVSIQCWSCSVILRIWVVWQLLPPTVCGWCLFKFRSSRRWGCWNN